MQVFQHAIELYIFPVTPANSFWTPSSFIKYKNGGNKFKK